MTRLLIAIGLVLATVLPMRSQETKAPARQTSHTLERSISKVVRINYLLFLPQDYKDDAPQRWPLLLFLHGAGERGTNINLVTTHGPPKIVQTKSDFPFIVVSPQCPPGQRWENEVLLGLLSEVTEKYRADTNRIYLTGLSMGGFGTWSLGLSRPELFAAIAPICGGGDPIGVLLPDPKKTAALKSLPVWAFHGAKDPVVKLEESQRMIDALKKIGNDAKLTVYPEAGHDSWTQSYENPELYDWFLKQSLAKRPVK